MATKYPQLVFTLTDGDKNTNISFNGVKPQLGTDDVRDLGLKLATAKGSPTTYVEANLITSTLTDKNS